MDYVSEFIIKALLIKKNTAPTCVGAVIVYRFI